MTSKIALVTGASRGLGRNTAVALAKHGIDVIGTFHSSQKEADALVSKITGLGRKAATLRLGGARFANL